MSKLIVQADDLAITHASSLGIIEAATNGIVRATGMFTNQPDAAFAAEKIRDVPGVDVGIDLNFVTGRPLLPPDEVPGLVDGAGRFRSSGSIRAQFPLRRMHGVYLGEFEVDPFDHDETLAEARAQVEEFLKLVGRPPAYVHHHSLVSLMSDQVLHEVAEEYGILAVDDLYLNSTVPWLPNDWYSAQFPLDLQAEADAEGAMERLLPEILKNEISILLTHPGYVDAELFDLSSYSVVRCRDQQLVTSPAVMQLLEENGVELTSYSKAGLS